LFIAAIMVTRMEPLTLITVVAVFILSFAAIAGGTVSLVRVFSRRGEMKTGSGEGNAGDAEEEREVERLARTLALVETARTEAELADRAKSDFLAIMSHELRTPLNSILGFAEIIEKRMFGPLGDDRYGDYVRDIRAGGEHMLSIVNDILDLSKIDAGGMDMNEETFDLLTVIRSAVHLVQDRAETGGLTLKVSLPENLPPLLADARLVKQMLINLLSNAIDSTPAEGWIVITAEGDGEGGLTVAVADTGVGIAEDDLALALTPFRTFGDSSARMSRGIGLGLPLVKSLIELHGGEFLINSKRGAGTTVALTFPPDRVGAGDVARSNGSASQP